MDFVEILTVIYSALSKPVVAIFLSVGILLTIKTGFLQIRAFPKFLRLLKKRSTHKPGTRKKTISSIHALFAAMATTLGMGSIISPSIAIMLGGPGALFWMVAYTFFAGIIKFAEVSFAIHTRTETPTGEVIGGPTQYLKLIHPWLAAWYGLIMIVVFAVWSGVQSNTLAKIFLKINVPAWQTGLILSIIVFIVLSGGARRVGFVASKLVPLMCALYVSSAFFILIKNSAALKEAFFLVINSAFSGTAAIGGFVGVSALQAMSAGIFKSIYTTEAGMGTSSIPHSLANVKKPTDQGIIAMFSVIADAFFSFISGLLIVVTGMWFLGTGPLDSTLMYEVFRVNFPAFGGIILTVSIGLFVLTTTIGNSFNGSQNFSSITKHRWVRIYHIFTVIVIFAGALASVPLVWRMVDILIILVAVPNVISIAILTFKKSKVLKL